MITKFRLFENENILNRLLDKISKTGYDSLTMTEKEHLTKLSKGKNIFTYKEKEIKSVEEIPVFSPIPDDNFMEFSIPSNPNKIFGEELFNIAKELQIFLVYEVSDDMKGDRYGKAFVQNMANMIEWIYNGEEPIEEGETLHGWSEETDIIETNLKRYIEGSKWAFDNRTCFYYSYKDKEWFLELKKMVNNLIDKLIKRIILYYKEKEYYKE